MKMKELEAKKMALRFAGIEPTDKNIERLERSGRLTINTAYGSDMEVIVKDGISTRIILIRPRNN